MHFFAAPFFIRNILPKYVLIFLPRATPPGPDVSPSDAAEEPAAKHVLDLSVEHMDLSVSDDDAASSGDVSVADTVLYDYSDDHTVASDTAESDLGAESQNVSVPLRGWGTRGGMQSVAARIASRRRSERHLAAQFRIYAGACMRECADPQQRARFHAIQHRQEVASRSPWAEIEGWVNEVLELQATFHSLMEQKALADQKYLLTLFCELQVSCNQEPKVLSNLAQAISDLDTDSSDSGW